MVGFHGDHEVTGQRRCELYLTPAGYAKDLTTRLSPVYLALMLKAPTASLCPSNPQFAFEVPYPMNTGVVYAKNSTVLIDSGIDESVHRVLPPEGLRNKFLKHKIFVIYNVEKLVKLNRKTVEDVILLDKREVERKFKNTLLWRKK